MLQVPIADVPNQSVSSQLGGQNCMLKLTQRSTGFFADIYLNGTLLLAGVVCENNNRLIRDAYFGFVGDFVFFDTQGTSDPSTPGLNSRYLLVYLEATDL